MEWIVIACSGFFMLGTVFGYFMRWWEKKDTAQPSDAVKRLHEITKQGRYKGQLDDIRGIADKLSGDI